MYPAACGSHQQGRCCLICPPAGPSGALTAMLLAKQVGRSSTGRTATLKSGVLRIACVCAACSPCSVQSQCVSAMPPCAWQGWRVDVFERLAPLVDEEGNVQASIGPRSYNILLRWVGSRRVQVKSIASGHRTTLHAPLAAPQAAVLPSCEDSATAASIPALHLHLCSEPFAAATPITNTLCPCSIVQRARHHCHGGGWRRHQHGVRRPTPASWLAPQVSARASEQTVSVGAAAA